MFKLLPRFAHRALALAALPLYLAACGPSMQQQADYDAVQRAGVSPAIYDKMLHGDPLSVSDIAALGQARVNDGIIIRYIRDQGTRYYISPPDVQYLQSSHVSQSVIDYMLATMPPGAGPGSGPNVGIGIMFGPFWHHWR
jgi:hypothetical protein